MATPASRIAIPTSQFLPLAFCAFAGPVTWTAHIMLNYGVASRLCFPGRAPHLLTGLATGTLVAMIGVDVLAVSICAASAGLAYRMMRAARDPHQERTRFIGQCGLFAGVGFSLATLFDAIALFMVPLCAS